ncbi:MAG TPA: hypothetical protein VEH29_11700, partial [Acidimicrobiales bacterium]|nr:hypothetical protein [Acidimicrobiales bacterium]
MRTFYATGEDVILEDLPAGTTGLLARRASGEEVKGVIEGVVEGVARLEGLASGTYVMEAVAADGKILAEEMTTVGAHPGERPVLGFATSFDETSVEPVLDWLRALRCTVVQIY